MKDNNLLEELAKDGKMSVFKMVMTLMKLKAKLGDFKPFLKASKLIVPIAGSMEEMPPERIAKIERILESARKIMENSATRIAFETDDMPLIVMETGLAPCERLALLENALRNKEDLIKSFRFISEEKYALIFVIKTENSEEIRQVAGEIVKLLSAKFPDFAFFEDKVAGEIGIVTTKDITIAPQSA